MAQHEPTLGHLSIEQRANGRLIDPHAAVLLEGAGRATRAADRARALIAENAHLMRVLGAVLERTGPIELDRAVTAPESVVLYEIERYESHDGLTDRWVSKRVHG
jgi:hypothetical protein